MRLLCIAAAPVGASGVSCSFNDVAILLQPTLTRKYFKRPSHLFPFHPPILEVLLIPAGSPRWLLTSFVCCIGCCLSFELLCDVLCACPKVAGKSFVLYDVVSCRQRSLSDRQAASTPTLQYQLSYQVPTSRLPTTTSRTITRTLTFASDAAETKR